MADKETMRGVIVIPLNVDGNNGLASAQFATAIRAIQGVKTEQMEDHFIIGIGETAQSVIDYLKEIEIHEH